MKLQTKPAWAKRGFVLIYYTLCLTFILSVVGLAVDLGMLYNVKAKLTGAIDGAALAGGRCLDRGISFANAQPIATDTAKRWFAANFPAGWWGTVLNTGDPQVSVTNTDTGAHVSITASAKSPLMFLSIFGYPTSTVASSAVVIRRNVNLVLVIDRSGSVGRAGAGPDVRSSAINFVSKRVEDADLVGLVSFSGYVRKHFDLKTVFKTQAATEINAIAFDGNTNSSAALSTAYNMLVALDQPGAINVIVFFTDGRPTALSADFPVRTIADTGNDRYGTGVSNFAQGTKYAYPATNACTIKTFILGFIATPTGWPPSVSGNTSSILKETATTSSDDDGTIAPTSSGCFCRTGSPGDPTHVPPIAGNTFVVNGRYIHLNPDESSGRVDVAYVPSPDHYGNTTDASNSYMVPDTFPGGTAYPGKIRPDSPRAIRYAAYNAVDSCAKRIRADTRLNPWVFTIGLGGEAGEEPIDDVLLERLANDPTSPIFDSTRPQGIYARVDDSSRLNEAYDRIASQITRLAQ